MISSLLNEYASCLLSARVGLWNCGTVETGACSLMAHMVNDLQLPNDYEYCLLNARVDLWNCGTVETGACSLMAHMVNDLQFSQWV